MNSYLKDKKTIWQAPWGYSESFVIVLGVAIIGLMLEIVVGSFDFYLLTRPVNYIACCCVTLLSIIIGARSSKSGFTRWIVSSEFSVALICILLLLTIIMGVVPQMTHSHTLLGFDSMTSNWAFVMIYSITLFVVGAITAKRVKRFKLSDISFYLNHLGLYILLLTAGLGYSDMQRYIMYVNEGDTEWRVYDNSGEIVELPIAISLKDFKVEYYPSKAIYFDATTGEVQKGNPKSYENNERYKKVMSEPEPKRFSSEVEVFTQQGNSLSATIEVNKPLKIDSWSIYQYGYDNQAGNLSEYSSFELVYDSWIRFVYIGIIMMMLGSLIMSVKGRKMVKK